MLSWSSAQTGETADLTAVAAGEAPATAATKAIGCTIKWRAE